MTSYWRTLLSFNRNIRLYLFVSALVGFSCNGIYAVLLNLYLLRLGYGPEFVGLVHAAGLLAHAAFALPAGGFGRRWGVRRMMIAGLSLRLVGLGALPLAEFVPAMWRMAWPLGTYLLAMLADTMYAVNDPPFLMACASLEERSRACSVRGALQTLAAFLGSLVGGVLPSMFAAILKLPLGQPAPYRYPLLVAAVLLLPGVTALLATQDISIEQKRREKVEAGPFPFGPIVFLSLVALLRFGGYGVVTTFFNLYLDAGLHVPTAQIGALMAAGQLVAVPAALMMPAMTRRWSKTRVFALGTLGIAVSLLPLALIPRWWAAGLSYMGMLALFSITSPTSTVYQMELVSAGWRTAMSAIYTMASGLSWSAMALGGGYAITLLGYRSLFLIGAMSTGLAAFVFWAYFRVPRGELAKQPALDWS